MKPAKTCKVCGIPIARRNVSGMCKSHFMHFLNNDPETRAKQRQAALDWARNNPEAISLRSRKTWAKRRANPESMAAQAERMRTICQPASATPEAIARRDSEQRAKAISRGRNPWCPDEYRAEYLRLVKNKVMKGAEAKEIILAQIAADKARAKACLSPFERQERALRRGATIQDNTPVTRWSEAANELREKIG